MIIWLNGAFGAGKTQTAFELHSRIPNSFVFDPEEIGFLLRKITPSAINESDFQDNRLWREFTYQSLQYLAETFEGIVIVPMTLVNLTYYDQIVGTLHRQSFPIHHFTLCASRETILRRLCRRGDGVNSWAASQLDRCLNSLSNEIFAIHLDTENKSIELVAEEIAEYIGLNLNPPKWHPALRPLQRIIVQISHIRF